MYILLFTCLSKKNNFLFYTAIFLYHAYFFLTLVLGNNLRHEHFIIYFFYKQPQKSCICVRQIDMPCFKITLILLFRQITHSHFSEGRSVVYHVTWLPCTFLISWCHYLLNEIVCKTCHTIHGQGEVIIE